jgi:hypothetical protein
MDNFGSHKAKAVRRLIRSAGAKLFFLPSYSPDLNPIEQVSPSSRPCCARPTRARSRPPGATSVTSSIASPRGMRQLSRQTPAMLRPKGITL